MFANRFTAFIDACSLVSVLRRNLLLTLAEAEFFRVRWSEQVLEETERAIAKICTKKNYPDAADRAALARQKIESAFEDAKVSNFDQFMITGEALPDQNDAHVLDAALKIKADTIVTENLRDFPPAVLEPLNIEVRSADAFIADTIALDAGRAVAAINKMRLRLRKPEMTPNILLQNMDASGLTETVDILRHHTRSL